MGVMAGDRQSRFIISGKPIFHFFRPSTFSEFAMIHGGCLAKSNHEVPLDKVCVVSVVSQLVRDILMPLFPNETPCSECHATSNKGSTMAILCLGTVGLAAMEGARMAGTSRIMCVDLNHAKYEKGARDDKQQSLQGCGVHWPHQSHDICL